MPGSISFLLIGLVAALLLMRQRRSHRWGMALAVALVAGYWLLATMSVAGVMAFGLSRGFRPLMSPAQADGASAIVVLGGGNDRVSGWRGELDLLNPSSASRVLEAARVYHLLGNDPWVVASGGRTLLEDGAPPESATMRDVLVRLGVPPDRILLESVSHNTHDEAVAVPPILRAHGIRQFVLVTSPTHMLRALASFRAQGVDPVPAVATGVDWRASRPVEWVLPTEPGLKLGQRTLHEYLGLVYYGLRGWLRF